MTSSCEIGSLRLDLRAGVGVRERSIVDGALIYLSLLEDEMEARLEAFLATAPSADIAGLTSAAGELEPTDILVLQGHDGRTSVVRGGASPVPLYRAVNVGRTHLTTALPVAKGAALSRTGLAAAMAAPCLPGSYEPNAWTETPLAGWHRLRRGAVTELAEGRVQGERAIADLMPSRAATLRKETIITHLREAFAAYRRSQAHVTSSVVELSGGYDSTLAGAGALSPGHVMRGVSVVFPYYEFRFEAGVQEAVGHAFGIARSVLDGCALFPYAPPEMLPRFDEPAIFVTGIAHAERVARFAREHGASRLYMGHGGDQLFAADLTGSDRLMGELARGAFSGAAWGTVRGVLAAAARPGWLRLATRCFVYDARQDIWVKETFGPVIRTPFADLAVVKAAEQWSRWCATRGLRPDKSILAEALCDLLPDAVTGRKGKVAYDGVWMRAYAAHAEHIAQTLERAAGAFERIGLRPAFLLSRARALADWRPVSQREVLGAYAIAVWLASWGIERADDVTWV